MSVTALRPHRGVGLAFAQTRVPGQGLPDTTPPSQVDMAAVVATIPLPRLGWGSVDTVLMARVLHGLKQL